MAKGLAVAVGILAIAAIAVVAWQMISASTLQPAVTDKKTEAQSQVSSETSLPTPTQTAIQSSPAMKKTQYNKAPTLTIDKTKDYTAALKTNKGVLRVSLFAKETPITVNNFVFLAREGFYDKTVFHRIMKGFMIQGGDPKGDGTGNPGYRFNNEPVVRDYTRGTLAMANSGPNTNGSQFFIMHADYPLPKDYVIFGSIDPKDTASLTTLDAIADTPVSDNGMGETSKPQEVVALQSVTIEER